MLTGASGITAMSPALSAAGGRLVFSAYENDGYNIYALDTAEQLRRRADGRPAAQRRGAAAASRRRRARGRGAAGPDMGPAAEHARAGAETDTSRSGGSTSSGQPSVGVGVDPFGTYATGGMSFLFSDMLGNHVIGTAAQVTSRFDEFGGTLFYSTGRTAGTGAVARPDALRLAGLRGRSSSATRLRRARIGVLQRDQSASPASSRIRSAGRSAWSSPAATADRSELRRARSGPTRCHGQQLTEDEIDLETFPTLNLGEAQTALVSTTRRSSARPARFAAAVTAWSLAERRLAHLLRRAGGPPHLSDADPSVHDRAARDVLRAPRPRRGRRSGCRRCSSAIRASCAATIRTRSSRPNARRAANGSCPAFDRLIGSRVASRTPSCGSRSGARSAADQFYGPLPIEGAFFADAGVAWGQSARAGSLAGDNQPVVSVGAALRVNVLGFAVAEIDFVRPLKRWLESDKWGRAASRSRPRLRRPGYAPSTYGSEK